MGLLTIVKKMYFRNQRWRMAAILKTVKSPYLRSLKHVVECPLRLGRVAVRSDECSIASCFLQCWLLTSCFRDALDLKLPVSWRTSCQTPPSDAGETTKSRRCRETALKLTADNLLNKAPQRSVIRPHRMHHTRVVCGLGWPMGWVGSRFFSFS